MQEFTPRGSTNPDKAHHQTSQEPQREQPAAVPPQHNQSHPPRQEIKPEPILIDGPRKKRSMITNPTRLLKLVGILLGIAVIVALVIAGEMYWLERSSNVETELNTQIEDLEAQIADIEAQIELKRQNPNE